MAKRFQNRREAGRLLAERLKDYAGRPDVLVLALPRGGVPVAYEIAQALHVPLELLVVRKLGVPGQEELAMGAIASGGIRVMNEDVFPYVTLSENELAAIISREQLELERREKLYRGNRPALEIEGKTILLVDDGIATGTSMRTAVEVLKKQHPALVVVAVPVAPQFMLHEFHHPSEGEICICLMTPEDFLSVGLWYEDFTQTSDEEVRSLLDEAPLRNTIQ